MILQVVLCIFSIKSPFQRKTFFNFNLITKHSFSVYLIIDS